MNTAKRFNIRGLNRWCGTFIFLCRVVLFGATFLLSSCATRYFFEDMHSDFQVPEMPAIFASGKKGWVGTGYLLGNNQPAFTYATKDSVWWSIPDSSVFFLPGDTKSGNVKLGTIEGQYHIERSHILLGGAIAYQRLHWHLGAAIGFEEKHLFNQAGLFGGWSHAFGRWVPLFSTGFYANLVYVSGPVWYEQTQFPVGEVQISPGFYRDTVQGAYMDYSVPIRFGFLFQMFPTLATYFTIAANGTSVWPDEKTNPERYLLENGDLALVGVRYTLKTGMSLGLELALSTITGPGGNYHEATKLGFTLEQYWH